jgi:hypothetical protein
MIGRHSFVADTGYLEKKSDMMELRNRNEAGFLVLALLNWLRECHTVNKTRIND